MLYISRLNIPIDCIHIVVTNKPGTAQVGPCHIYGSTNYVNFWGKSEKKLWEKLKRYIRILKPVYPNFENVISEL